jgi:predicted DNA-binding transcriptional regulator YafY
MARGDQLIRQWKLLHVLGVRGGRSVDELMQEMRCSRRTVWRDLAVLQATGFPLTTEQDGRENRYRLIESSRDALQVPFTLTELMSLHLGRHLLVPLRGTPVGEAIHTALQKVSATLVPAAKDFLTSLDQTMSARAV